MIGRVWNAKVLVKILKCFQEALGLCVNLAKSKLYGIGVNQDEVSHIASIINCSHDYLPFKYLGLPVGKDMFKYNSWLDVIECFVKRLSSWKSKICSVGG